MKRIASQDMYVETPVLADDGIAKKNSKLINDPIHGYITMSGYHMEVIDTPQFQRLRDLKQLGSTYYTFPGASHNRFEHSIGVSHLAGTLMNRLKSLQPELDITKKDVKLVSISGLIHDLGHGPFSHSFEKWIRYSKPDVKFHHEEMSQKMFRYLVDDNALDYDETEIGFLEELVSGNYSQKNQDKAWMFEIVANNRNSVDVDKFDYLARDSYNCGVIASYDFKRLMIHSRVIDNEICYHAKEGWNLNSLFHTRYSLFKQIYTHRTGTSLDYMIGDVFSLADDVLKISDNINDPESYMRLTDCLLKEIEVSRNQELRPAQDLLKRIRKRELYSFVSEFIIPGDEIDKWKVPTPAELISYQSSQFQSLTENDIIVDTHKNNYAFKDKNPIESIKFFSNWDDQESFPLKPEEISLLTPTTFSETYVRIFCRQNDQDKIRAAQSAWRNYLEKNGNATPSKQFSRKQTSQSTSTQSQGSPGKKSIKF
jgi:HD superfamily phosphohydrolase